MSSPSAVVCREIFDENSQPSAEEISDYAHQLGIDPESESHLLPLAKDGLMQALPPPWKAYYDEKIESHYYYNEETKKTQWEHPLDNVYRELVKRARDASVQDDTCASVQELLTSEENTKHLERLETKVESDDDDLTTDSGDNHASDVKDSTLAGKRLTAMGRPPLGPLSRLDKKLSDLKISPLRRSVDSNIAKPMLMRNTSDKDLLSRPTLERPKLLFKQQSEIIDLKMHVLNSPEEENLSGFLSRAKVETGYPLTGISSMYSKMSKSDLPSPDTEKSLPLDSITRSDPLKGILREKMSDSFLKRNESLFLGKSRHASSLDEDRKSVRFKLENLPEPTISPGSDSSEQNDQHSIVSAPVPSIPSPVIPSSPISSIQVLLNPLLTMKPSSPSLSPLTMSSVPLAPITPSIVLSPLVTRPPLPPKPIDSPRESKSVSASDRESLESDRGTSPRRRVLRPPAGDYIKPELFQKNFQKISDMVRPGDLEPSPVTSLHLVPDSASDKEFRPRSPMIPQLKNKISINLMESIESETSIDSPDKEFANLDLNDLDDSNNINEKSNNSEKEKDEDKDSPKTEDDSSDKTSNSKTSQSPPNKSPKIDSIPATQVKVPKLDLSPKMRVLHSESEESRKVEDSNRTPRSESMEMKSPHIKVSPTPSLGSDLKSPRYESNRWSNPLSTFKPLNKAVIAPLKSSDSVSSLGKSLASPRLDGVILSQGKSSSDNVVVVYQFEQEEKFSKSIKSPLIPDMGREIIERNKGDERRRLELSLQKELESMRVEFTAKERNKRAELQQELKEAEEKFLLEKKMRLTEQAERQQQEMEEALSASEINHEAALQELSDKMAERLRIDTEAVEKRHGEAMAALEKQCRAKLAERREQIEIENERALADLHSQLSRELNQEKARMVEENRATIEALREEHSDRVNELKQDYRAEVERLRAQHSWHLQEVRARGAPAAGPRSPRDLALQDKYRCLKEKYVKLKHDVKMSIERRNKRREMSMTTGSETEKSNSHKATQSLERCKELNETSVSVVIEHEPRRNNNPTIKYNDNETSHSESNALSHAQKSYDNNNDDWRVRRDNSLGAAPKRSTRRAAVAFREPVARGRSRDRDRDRERDRDAAATTDCQDSSDATTADDKPKEAINGHGRRRCFTRLKSASTSRLNYSPKRGEGWSSPLESLRQQLRKLDDLEDQFPDLACQPSYSLRYPFAELGSVCPAGPEVEFVRHRALVEREGMRRARRALRRRRRALRQARDQIDAHRPPSEERESTELEVALHRARALLGEKDIRLKHIERALRRLSAPSHPPTTHPPTLIQEATTSEASSGSESSGPAVAGAAQASGAVLRSLRALHADVRDIWRALDMRARNTSPETSSCNAPSTSQTRMTLSAPEPSPVQDTSDGGVAERARGLRAWLQTAP